jgi:hypothetical protein
MNRYSGKTSFSRNFGLPSTSDPQILPETTPKVYIKKKNKGFKGKEKSDFLLKKISKTFIVISGKILIKKWLKPPKIRGSSVLPEWVFVR